MTDSHLCDGALVLHDVCGALMLGRIDDAAEILQREYPFTPYRCVGRKSSPKEYMQVFCHDGFVDRYSGKRLVFPGTLRLLSKLLPEDFPFQSNWRTDSCHFAYWDLFPTIDHITPVSRGGSDTVENWVCTSMMRNQAKGNFTLQELGWELHPRGCLKDWDGLTAWFVRRIAETPELLKGDRYLKDWLTIAEVAITRSE